LPNLSFITEAAKIADISPSHPGAFVGRKISDVGDRGTPGHLGEWQGAIRLKRVDMLWIWEVY
jgi:hypothetical protein